MCYRQLSFVLSLSVMAVLGSGLSAQAQTCSEAESEAKGTQSVRLHYFRNAQVLVNLINLVKAQEDWKNVKIIPVSHTETIEKSDIDNSSDTDTHKKSSNNEIILYGTSCERKSAYRVIAAIDLPRPGITMQMWGIQISSNNPDDLAKVMLEVRREINQTQKLVQETYARIQQYTALNINDNEIEDNFKTLVNELGYESALSANRPLSMTDIVLRIVSAERQDTKVTQNIANKLTEVIEGDERYKYYLDTLRKEGGQPLERFFSMRGLKCKVNQNKNAVNLDICKWEEEGDFANKYAEVSRTAILDFALHYGHFISKPGDFSPYDLQQSADILNNRLQDTMDALNKDIEDFFIRPTLIRIQNIVGKFKDVEYAQVGRTTIASLSGIKTTVESNSVNVFDVTPPLKLSDLLQKATTLESSVSPYVPELPTATGSKKPMLGSLPLERVISLVAAFQEQDAKFRQLNTGVTLKVTPNILRNMNSAELNVDLIIVDPVASGSQQKESEQPLSRIGKQEVTTTVYTKAVDFFALSTFSNQSTLSGGRGYVPIIGTVWRGIFGEVPVLGKLFSWKRGPKKVLHESLLLTNSFITPTAMGMGLLYPVESKTFDNKTFDELNNCVKEYQNNREQHNSTRNNRVFENKQCKVLRNIVKVKP
jgi:hypothetical protein